MINKEGHEVGYEMAKAKYERPQGEMINKTPYGWWYCSECGKVLEPQDKFCWNCGAEMRKEAENE